MKHKTEDYKLSAVKYYLSNSMPRAKSIKHIKTKDRKVPEKRYACESIEDSSQNCNPGWGDIGNQIS